MLAAGNCSVTPVHCADRTRLAQAIAVNASDRSWRSPEGGAPCGAASASRNWRAALSVVPRCPPFTAQAYSRGDEHEPIRDFEECNFRPSRRHDTCDRTSAFSDASAACGACDSRRTTAHPYAQTRGPATCQCGSGPDQHGAEKWSEAQLANFHCGFDESGRTGSESAEP